MNSGDLPRIPEMPDPGQMIWNIFWNALGHVWWLLLILFALAVVQAWYFGKLARRARQMRKDDITEAVKKALEEDRRKR